MKKLMLSLAIVFLQGNNLIAQNTQQEIGFQTDNDSYSGGTDRYYTNGLFIFYRKAIDFDSQKNTKLANKVIGIEVGQKMYTPSTIIVTSTDKIDRPYAGYLYIEPHLNLLYKNESNLKLSGQLGIIGKNSGAESTQDLIHDIVGFDQPQGWEYQIKDQFIINFSAEYNKLLLRESFYDLTFNSKANLGTGFVGANTGATIRIGKFNPLYNSILTQSSVSTEKLAKNKELHFFYNPRIHFIGYDATVQGNIFRKHAQEQEITSSIKHYVITNQLGVNYRINRFSASAMVLFQSKDVSTMNRKNHKWGTFIVSYLF